LELLLQPVVVGLLAVAIGVLIQNLNGRRRHETPILTLSSPSDFIAPSSSSVERQAAIVIGSDEPTAVRPAKVALSESHSSVRSRADA
jgi:hypothetical protein